MSLFISQNVPGGDDPAGASEEFDQVLALREEVERLRGPVQRTLLLRPSDSPYEQLQVVVGGIDHGGTGKPRRGRVLLAYTAVEDHDILVPADLTSLAQFREGGKGGRGFGAHVAHPRATRGPLHGLQR